MDLLPKSSIYFYILLYTSIYFYILLYASIYFYILLYTSIYFYILLYTSIYFYILLYTSIYFYINRKHKVTKQLTQTYNTAYSTVPHSVLSGNVNAYSTLWHSYNDDHRGQLIADVFQNSDHITLNTNTPTRVPNTTLQQTSSPDITTVSNTLYNRTSWTTQYPLSSDHLLIITTINIRHDYRLQQNRRTFTNYKKADWTEFTSNSLRPPYPPTYTLPI